MTARSIGRLVALLVCGLVPAVASAQTAAPAQGQQQVAAPRRPAARQREAASLAISSSVSADSDGRGGSRTPAGGNGANLSSDLRTSFKWDSTPGSALSWQVGAGSAVRNQPNSDGFMFMGANAGTGIGFALGRRTHVQASGSFGYVPTYSLVMTPNDFLYSVNVAANLETLGQVSREALDYSVVRNPAYSSGANVSLSRQLGSRSSLSVSYNLQRTDFSTAADPSMRSWSAGAHYGYKLGRYMGLRLGYGRRRAQYMRIGGPANAGINDIDAGVDYARPLALSRRTSISFSTGSSLTSNDATRSIALTGSAHLDHSIGRTGHLTLAYDRGAHLMQGFTRPVFADSISAGASVRLAPRFSLQASVSGANGNVGASSAQNSYRNYTGSARFTTNVTRRAGVYAEYLYYRHHLGAMVDVVGTPSGAHGRQTGRVGFTLLVPVIREWVVGRGGN